MAQDTRAYAAKPIWSHAAQTTSQCGMYDPISSAPSMCLGGFLMIWSLRTDRITSSHPGRHTKCWGSWILTPCRLPFVRLALWADCLLLWGLVLAVLPPFFQLEVNEFPHHPGLCQADSCQTSHPKGWRGHPLRTAKAILLVNGKTKLWPFCCF